ncbi:hypothetical protein Scep_006119 [Stephania cephalantha]|uniref:Uncharacterized protein n=1 Tax=Stephania cephalantha TaxID=152367 RepID=A0AAP0K9W7_9MAGN
MGCAGCPPRNTRTTCNPADVDIGRLGRRYGLYGLSASQCAGTRHRGEGRSDRVQRSLRKNVMGTSRTSGSNGGGERSASPFGDVAVRWRPIKKLIDEWKAREIAKDIAKRKLELVLVVEKLQELRSIRIQKLKKQVLGLFCRLNVGRATFSPEEDDKFFERVRAAYEEAERQAAAAADTGAAKDAIAMAEESSKSVHICLVIQYDLIDCTLEVIPLLCRVNVI